MTNKVTGINFAFHNNVAPRYVEPLLLRLESDRWYSTSELVELLRADGSGLQGVHIVLRNTYAWSLVGLGESKTSRVGRSTLRWYQLNSFGRQLIEIYSTNQILFYDVMHFLFYCAWSQTHDLRRAQFWMYFHMCNVLWAEAPQQVEISALANRVQAESQQAFPQYMPAFSTRAVQGVSTWLKALSPPFLHKSGSTRLLVSARRSHCTPQLFHLSFHCVYSAEGLKYGTSMAVDSRHINEICRMCLLDVEQFWPMAELAKLSIRGFDIRKGQWGTSIVIDGPPSWITPPAFVLQRNLLDSPDGIVNDNDERIG
jgi:hypothetical protein